jgi:hypothetical protein
MCDPLTHARPQAERDASSGANAETSQPSVVALDEYEPVSLDDVVSGTSDGGGAGEGFSAGKQSGGDDDFGGGDITTNGGGVGGGGEGYMEVDGSVGGTDPDRSVSSDLAPRAATIDYGALAAGSNGSTERLLDSPTTSTSRLEETKSPTVCGFNLYKVLQVLSLLYALIKAGFDFVNTVGGHVCFIFFLSNLENR